MNPLDILNILFPFLIILILIGIIKEIGSNSELKTTDEELNKYLDTVENRAQLSTSVDALILLSDELIIKTNCIMLKETYHRLICIQSFIIGKAAGLRKDSFKFKI